MSETVLTEAGTSRFVETKRWRIHYNEAGEGAPVLLLHGSGPGATGWSNFSPNLAPLAERFHVYAVDMPGWGKTESNSAQDRDHVEAGVLFLDELGIDKAAIIGNSMGGMTGIRLAIQHPERISHLIPMGSPAPGANILNPGGALTEGLQVLIDVYQDPSPENFKRLVRVMAFDPVFATDELAQQRSKMPSRTPTTWRASSSPGRRVRSSPATTNSSTASRR